MKEHPILFSAPMVHAILEGRKTMTRRVVDMRRHGWPLREGVTPEEHAADIAAVISLCPYGQPSDRLWVRETWDFRSWERDTVRISYGAGGLQEDRVPPSRWNPTVYNYERWRPSIHMPRWASRLSLEVTAVRVERLQDISEEDARAEGADKGFEMDVAEFVTGKPIKNETYRTGFRLLWDSINAKRGYGWGSNPWVWVVEFKKVEP